MRQCVKRLVVLGPAAVVLAAALGSCGATSVSRSGPALTLEPGGRPVPAATKAIGMMFNFPPADPAAPRQEPGFFVRAANSLAAHGDVLDPPVVYDTVLYEGELVIVIGKRARRVTPEEAGDCILGYTCGMDGSPLVLDAAGERDPARSLAGKSADGVAPVGPRVVAGIDASDLEIALRVNGEVVEQCSTRDLVWKPEQIVAEVSRAVTLEPGDLIFAGATRAVPKFRPGDRVEVEISGIGVLANRIAGGE